MVLYFGPHTPGIMDTEVMNLLSGMCWLQLSGVS